MTYVILFPLNAQPLLSSTHTASLTFHSHTSPHLPTLHPHTSPHLPPTHLYTSPHLPPTHTPHLPPTPPLTFHTWNDSGSTTVGWTISLPGKTPQVTAIGVAVQFVMSSDPWKWLNHQQQQQQQQNTNYSNNKKGSKMLDKSNRNTSTVLFIKNWTTLGSHRVTDRWPTADRPGVDRLASARWPTTCGVKIAANITWRDVS